MIDSILLEVLWKRLLSIVNEQAAALIHSSFTTLVREAGDLSAGVFDAQGRMLAQAVTGTPGHINTMANCVRDHVVKQFPIETLQPGDTIITNDPWAASGHLFDQTIVSPVFYKGKGIGWFASTCHAMDIGGLTMGGDATELFEEGLFIPLMKLFKAGEPNKDLFDIIRANVRVPDEVIGDIYAQQAGNMVGSRKLIEMMEEYKLASLDELSELILDRTEKGLRDAIEKIPNGVYRSAVTIDGFDDPVTIQCKVTVNDRDIIVDFDGTSPQIRRGINVVMNYTHAYSTYTLMCAVAPDIPNNEGAFRPIKVIAPEGSILNCRKPAPVSARHLIGHFVSQPILHALSNPIPNNVIADGSAGLWNTMFEGELKDSHDVFAYIYFSAGGMGARPYRDGLSATAFPSGITGVPAEVIESVAPIRMHKRELLADTGGAGKFRGGLGQEMILEVLTGKPATHSCMYDRTKFAARGFHGGQDGSPGEVIRSDGYRPHPKSRYTIQPGQTVTLRLPGGGGFYSPLERDPVSVLEDVKQGYVSLQAAREKYGVVIVEGRVDEERTREERRKRKEASVVE
ncbi:MAG TPA: hydantoinase B/oxoprolinase family protein [Anaerolineales bacterium]|nr:hydantoinase B/oxoprolinase family protein [Anaerolineales bacterium]HNQ95058.1 hydantoinase B/oxoprolinase family protein [Anaerolineales bacterium]HNS62570.1 hydantoinase B/oxoprolinase family protein [Anaerolineales bacterium]